MDRHSGTHRNAKNQQVEGGDDRDVESFVQNGMTAIALEHATYMKTAGSKTCIALPTLAYESLLHEAFYNLPLSILSKDDTPPHRNQSALTQSRRSSTQVIPMTDVSSSH
jgi:hypothetical protein